jgi:hypothetical protein
MQPSPQLQGAVYSNVVGISSGGVKMLSECVGETFLAHEVGRRRRDPSVPQCSDPSERGVNVPADPYRYGSPGRAGRQSHPVEVMPSTLEVYDRLTPQLPQQPDLLVNTPASIRVCGIHRLKLAWHPSQHDCDPQAPTAEDINLCGLLGDQRRLPLREHHGRGHP